MFNPDPKKIVAALLIKHKPGEDPGAEDSDSEPLETAAQDVLDAIKGGKASDFAEALKAFCQLCDEGEGEEK